jgi:hypothetical protein
VYRTCTSDERTQRVQYRQMRLFFSLRDSQLCVGYRLSFLAFSVAHEINFSTLFCFCFYFLQIVNP